jgi:hypothetical protein
VGYVLWLDLSTEKIGGKVMVDFEYEVLFVQGGVNVRSLAFVGGNEVSEGETIREVAVRRALANVNYELGTGFDDDDFEEISATYTGTIGG